jgi:hypothetical protein
MPTLNNYTVSPVTFSVVEGSEIYDTRQTATLVIMPNPGFTVTAADFSIRAGSIPDGIASVVFSQSGSNVNCVVTFENNFVMPSNNLDFDLCIEGSAREIEFLLKTSWNSQTIANATWSNPNFAISQREVYGTTITVGTNVITAASGHRLTDTQLVYDFEDNNFSYTETKGYDVDDNWISTTYTVIYTYPMNDVDDPDSNDDGYFITFTAASEEVYEQEPVITAYSLSSVTAPAFGGDVNITVYGNPGATFSIERFDPVGSEVIVDEVTLTGYNYSYLQTLPSVAEATEYEFVITGDLSDSFDTVTGQSSTFYVNQYMPVTITLDATGTDLEGYAPVTRTYEAYSVPVPNSTQSVANFTWNITSTANDDLSIISQITDSDWDNLAPAIVTTTAAVNNSVTVPLSSTTGLSSGMPLQTGDLISNVFIDTVVNPTSITLTEPITVASGEQLVFLNNNQNGVGITSRLSLSNDLKTLSISIGCIINNYGTDNITFTLDLDNIVAVASPPACVEFFATSGAYPGTVDYLDCSSVMQTITLSPNQVSAPVFGLAGSQVTNGQDIIITLV